MCYRLYPPFLISVPPFLISMTHKPYALEHLVVVLLFLIVRFLLVLYSQFYSLSNRLVLIYKLHAMISETQLSLVSFKSCNFLVSILSTTYHQSCDW